MQKAIRLITSLIMLCAAAYTGRAIEMTWEYSVQASATVQASPAQITLSWPQDQYMLPNSYTIYRKAPADSSWGTGISLPGSATSYTDNNVIVGTAYEYQIVKTTSLYTGYGYLYSGINVPMTDARGKLLLVVDNSVAPALTNELAQLQQDLTGDGWTVIRLDVSRDDSAVNIKNLIKAQYNADPANVKSVFLFGHVPVPYSGDIVPDGHIPNHQGAWPADGYYGDLDGAWTDNSVNDSGADYARNHNVPGDGKFDQSTFPAPLKLMVGRVDLANLPGALWYGGPATFPSEIELLRNYLNKDHKFRTKQFDVPRRALVGDFFGVRNGEAFAASGWRNAAALVGASNVSMTLDNGVWTPTLAANPYLFAYGAGAGSFGSIAGLGNSDAYHDLITTELYSNDVKAVFTLLFGSWLGDWDSSDNIMRAVLALPSCGLACAWSGRPHWFMQHLGLGETLGFTTRLTQNNGANGLYQNQINTAAGQVHIALMGDPTLRLHPVAPPVNLQGSIGTASATLSWTAPNDSVVGYHVYRCAANGAFTRLTSAPLTTSSFIDVTPNGATNYMVRSVKLETSASGSYYNPSVGAFLTPMGSSAGSIIGSGNTGSDTNSTSITNATPTTGSSTNLPGTTVWVDDTLPAGAVPGSDGGDTWNWTSSNPAPFSGNLANQSSFGAGLHQHYFTFASQTLTVNLGDFLYAYVYLDPAYPPSEIMLQWNDGSWEHRAFWGANTISYGSPGTAGRVYMGALPPAGRWTLLQVPAGQVGLQGSTLNGMAFTLFDGRATWDDAGKTSAPVPNSGSATNSGTPPITSTNVPGTNTPATTNSAVTFNWVDDALPAGAVPGSDGGDVWNWTGSNPAPESGRLANQSSLGAGLHQHYFTAAKQTLTVNRGDVLYAYVFLDPANPPSQVMLQWNDGSWEHRAYWGANNIFFGDPGTAGRVYVGPLPAAGQWVLLQVPASQVGLEGSTLNGMAFSQYDGRATWDNAGKASTLLANSGPGSSTNSVGGANSVNLSNVVAWVDDALPTGATGNGDGGDNWNWVGNNPAPFSGTLASQSSLTSGLHQHYFTSATRMLGVNAGDILFAYVYLDPANLPSEIMLQWNDGSWEHRAFWGANTIDYGMAGTAGRVYMGPLPAPGQWTLLQVPASQVGLGGASLNGMAFTLSDGRATWDYAGKASAVFTNGGGSLPPVTSTNGNGSGTNIIGGGSNTNSTDSTTNIVGGGSDTNIVGNGSSTNSSGVGNTSGITNSIPNVSSVDYVTPQLPKVGDNALHVLTPTLLELKLINTKQPDPAPVQSWNFVNGGTFTPPASSQFVVTADGQPVVVTAVGFKRRPLYAPMAGYDLRIENSLYLQLAAPVSSNQQIQVANPDGTLWSAPTTFGAKVDPLRYSPAIHVNQEGYMPNYSKKAMVGYYLGSLGELTFPASSGFTIVDANTGAQAFQGALVQRPDSGFTYSPTPYQQVYEADFTALDTPGEYRLVVPGMGGSLPFLIHDGIAMDFARAYALGLYHQRCGTNTAMPYTRFTHDVCHPAPANVPTNASAYPFTWTTVAGYANSLNANNPPQIAPALTSPAAQLFPFVNQGPIDVSGGHHDAGDYSKYTINSASLVHYLMFAVDSLPGAASLDNLGIPESGDGISDIMQEAKWEADFLAKLQDKDGGFYFLVYPQNREYEDNVTPDHGDPQVVWPKTTSVTAASVAALAQCASSPLFKKTYPAAAAMYLQKAVLGWQFLTSAVAKYGKSGAYQKITHYGDNFADNDELAWAACQIFLATGDTTAHQLLLSWFDPSDPATWRWGWWHMSECYGHTMRSYAFAVSSGRATAGQLDATFLGKCQAQIAAAADDVMNFARQTAYGTSFQSEAKSVQSAGWYFSADQAFDLAVAYQLNAKPEYMTAMVENMNYEGGCNPVNVCYVTGLGWRRQRDIVSGWALNDKRVLPPSGIPVGNIQTGFNYLWDYAGALEGLCFPSDNSATAPYPFYDRWGDSWNVTTEMVVLNQARGLGMLAFLAAQGPYKTQVWTAPANASINVPATVVPVGTNVALTLSVPGMDLTGARITWEGSGQEPAFGSTFNFTPTSSGTQVIEAEAQWPDGRRAFAQATFTANSPNIIWVNDSLPAGAVSGADGGDSWNWVNSSPAPFSGTLASQSAIAAGEHQHYFSGASATLAVGTGDVLYAYVYLDPASMPSEIMLQWNDGSGWDHRAYWGANNLDYGASGTPGHVYMGTLPAAGQWVQLKVPASLVGLEGKTVSGLAFTLYDGRATWDAAGRVSPGSSTGHDTGTITTTISPSINLTPSGVRLTWPSTDGSTYQIFYKNSLSDALWTAGARVPSAGTTTTWTDISAPGGQRFFVVTQLN